VIKLNSAQNLTTNNATGLCPTCRQKAAYCPKTSKSCQSSSEPTKEPPVPTWVQKAASQTHEEPPPQRSQSPCEHNQNRPRHSCRLLQAAIQVQACYVMCEQNGQQHRRAAYIAPQSCAYSKAYTRCDIGRRLTMISTPQTLSGHNSALLIFTALRNLNIPGKPAPGPSWPKYTAVNQPVTLLALPLAYLTTRYHRNTRVLLAGGAAAGAELLPPHHLSNAAASTRCASTQSVSRG
jgi:hypothetical protein